ncbi:unnamed protein product [Caenorhabditis bovis]|uniref:Uncharacterized protein n=1 Tax=Caenorhabditis bovis TaxID=2654633 RepID=A0A8S1FCM5_9PELO|nr:unnamed protein product [Caenorhabditis bovis]
MSFQLTLLSMFLLLIAIVIGRPQDSQESKIAEQDQEYDKFIAELEPYLNENGIYDAAQQMPVKAMEKRWANQVRFGKPASWASSVRFG